MDEFLEGILKYIEKLNPKELKEKWDKSKHLDGIGPEFVKKYNYMKPENDYVSFEVAKLLKEKGYNERCDRFYAKIYDYKEVLATLTVYDSLSYKELEEGDILRPTLWDVQKWLREKYSIAICPNPYDFYWDYTIYDLKLINSECIHKILGSRVAWSSYEEALLKGIEDALKFI